jgi:hypothetical protein
MFASPHLASVPLSPTKHGKRYCHPESLFSLELEGDDVAQALLSFAIDQVLILSEVGADAGVDHAALVNGHVFAIDLEGGSSIGIRLFATTSND